MISQVLKGRVAVVTGGASGIGRVTALRLAEQGAEVTVGDVRLDPDNDEPFAAWGIRQQECDVRDLVQLKNLIDGAATGAGGLDILVNNAGVVQVGRACPLGSR